MVVALMTKFGSEVGNVRLLVALEPVRRLLALNEGEMSSILRYHLPTVAYQSVIRNSLPYPVQRP